ncbi:MAG TPA: class I SAM-dependent methyltransferase [Syntrophorhabdaceae bacterium]|nr:class I SAM-dependent methyltransferase [Syntrophorhabdaceae bacterium]
MIKKIITVVKNKYKNDLEILSYRRFLNNHKDLKNSDLVFTHLTRPEKKKLFELASKVGSHGFALEIGSYLGAFASFICAGLGKNSKLICIDTWENDAMSEEKRDTSREFDENTKIFKNKIIKIKGYSTEVVDKVERIASKIDLLFIDGDHSYEGCKKDWDLYKKFLKSGSCVVFHDIGWAEGVIRVIEENVKPNLRNFDSLRSMFWGYVK